MWRLNNPPSPNASFSSTRWPEAASTSKNACPYSAVPQLSIARTGPRIRGERPTDSPGPTRISPWARTTPSTGHGRAPSPPKARSVNPTSRPVHKDRPRRADGIEDAKEVGDARLERRRRHVPAREPGPSAVVQDEPGEPRSGREFRPVVRVLPNDVHVPEPVELPRDVDRSVARCLVRDVGAVGRSRVSSIANLHQVHRAPGGLPGQAETLHPRYAHAMQRPPSAVELADPDASPGAGTGRRPRSPWTRERSGPDAATRPDRPTTRSFPIVLEHPLSIATAEG